jgi:AraC-like DNA-binding protein
MRLARKHGFSLYCGTSPAPGSVPLGRSYRTALANAESALARRDEVSSAQVRPARPHTVTSFGDLRKALAKAVEEHPHGLPARFERYLEETAARCAHNLELARVHLEMGVDAVAAPLVTSGALDERTFAGLRSALEREADTARSIGELCSSYRRAIVDLSQAVARPVPARRDRSLRLALDYIARHYTERLRLNQVAKIAGFAPSHFSKLFIEREHLPFEEYLRALRLERAKHLLASTSLNSTRVAELSGFSSLQYFCHVFRNVEGTTPLRYRRMPRITRISRNEKTNKNAYKRTTGSRSIR